MPALPVAEPVPHGEQATRTRRAVLLVALALLLCLPPLTVVLMGLGHPRLMEDIAVTTSQETWLRQHGWQDIPADGRAWLLPTWNGRPRTSKPPMVIWLNMLAWSDLTPATSTPGQLLLRARLVAIGMTGVMLVGVFCIGLMLRDQWLGLIAALILGTMWFVQREGRSGAYDIHMAAWATLAIAGAVWAMRPFDSLPTLPRRAIGWTLTGICLACAWLSKGPLSLVVVLVPVATLIVLAPRDRGRHLLGAAGMLVLASALALPWYGYLLMHSQGAAGRLLHEYSAVRKEFQPPYYYLGGLALVAPWSLWLVAGLVQPFARAQGLERRRRLFAWCWLVVLFIFFSIPAAKQQRYLLPLMPAAALVAAQVFRDHEAAARQGRPDPGSARLYMPHWIALLLISALTGPLLTGQHWLIAKGILSTEFTAPISWRFTVPITLAALALAGAGWFWHRRGRVLRAAVATAVWMAVVSTSFWSAYAALPRPDNLAQARRIGALVEGQPVFFLTTPEYASQPLPNQVTFLFFSRRIYHPITPRDILDGALPGGAFVIAEAVAAHDQIMQEAGLTLVTDFTDERNVSKKLWHREAAAH